jgi:hypothetical protein
VLRPSWSSPPTQIFHSLSDSKEMSEVWHATLELGDCGMGMPVIRSNQKLRGMQVGEILRVSSGHP